MKVASLLLVLFAASLAIAGGETRLSLLCKSSEVTDAGFWAKGIGSNEYEKTGHLLSKQAETSQWRVDLKKDGTALVTRYSGSFREVESPAVWHVEVDPARTGFIIVPAKRTSGESPQAITITVKTLDFVYTTQHVNPMYNRANIWIGNCERLP